MLSQQLWEVLHETIHIPQGAFVEGRRILDAVLVANKVVDEKRRSREEGVVYKIDLEKVYDHMKLCSLDYALEMKDLGGDRDHGFMGSHQSVLQH